MFQYILIDKIPLQWFIILILDGDLSWLNSIHSNTLCIVFYQNSLMGVLAIFSTGTFAIIGTMCVESETCFGKYQEKKSIGENLFF